MRRFEAYAIGLLCWIALAPAGAAAQERKEVADDFIDDVLWSILGPNWNVSAHAGLSGNGRFLLQDVAVPGLGVRERALRGDDGYSWGAGAGVDILLRVGARINYTFTDSNLAYRGDNGDGSELLDVDDVGGLQSHMASVEIIRYMLTASSDITPYGTVGLVGTWWVVGDDGFRTVASGSTQFRMGALGSVGLQAKLSDRFDLRLEAATANVGNPFTGRESFRVLSGATIDEPNRVSKSDFRVIAMYNFGKPHLDLPTATRARAKR